MAAVQADNTAAVALLLKRRAPCDALNSCVPASISIEKSCLRPAPSRSHPCHRHGDDAVSIASLFGHLHLAQALKVQTALSARAIIGTCTQQGFTASFSACHGHNRFILAPSRAHVFSPLRAPRSRRFGHT